MREIRKLLILGLSLAFLWGCASKEEEEEDTSWVDYAVECRRVEPFTSLESVRYINMNDDIVIKPLNLIPTCVEQNDTGYCLMSIADIEVEVRNNTDEPYVFERNYTLKMWTTNGEGSLTLYMSGIHLDAGEARIETIKKVYLGEKWLGTMLNDVSYRFESIDYELLEGKKRPTVTTRKEKDEVIVVTTAVKDDGPSVTVTTADKMTMQMNSALRAAKAYVYLMPFSREGLIAQLIKDGYSKDEAIYGVDNSQTDWKEQATKQAITYKADNSYKNKAELMELLIKDGFTSEESKYAANRV